jgi:hypothetical protein
MYAVEDRPRMHTCPLLSELSVIGGRPALHSCPVSQTAQELTALARKLTPAGLVPGEAFALPGDLSSSEGCAALAAALAEREPRLHFLVGPSTSRSTSSIDANS